MAEAEEVETKMESSLGDKKDTSTVEIAIDPPIEGEEEDTDNATRKRPFQAVPIINGLKLKQKDHCLPFRTYNYTPAITYGAELTGTDWHLLSLYDMVRDHVRVHELKEGEDLLQCVQRYQRDEARAVIVINTTEDNTLPPDVALPLKAINNFLVGVVPQSVGCDLLECLQELFYDDELYARLDVMSSETTPLTIYIDSETAVLGMDLHLQHPQTSVTASHTKVFKFFGSRSNVFDLKSEIKKIMFEGNRLRQISIDGGLFTMIMANFSQFEKVGKSDPNQIGELIRRFHRFLQLCFHFEFPFFLCLVYRFRKFRHLYNCEELGPFITKCIEMFENISSHQVVETLRLFFDKKDFDVMFGHEEANTSVFTLLATACRDLMHLSMQIKSSLPTVAAKRTMYCRLLWISVNLKCLSEKGIVTKNDLAIWDKSIIKVSKKTIMTKDTIEDLKLGLELSAMLKLPADNQFTIHHLGCLLADDKSIRPLAYVRDVIVGLQDFIKTGRELLVHIMINLRADYTAFLQSTDPKVFGQASMSSTLLGILDEGISFLNCVTDVWMKKKWDKGEEHKDFRSECLKWMMLLLGTVRLTDLNAPQLLKKFLAPKKGSVTADREYRTHVVKAVLDETRNSFHELPIHTFYPLYKNYRIWPTPFLHDFLRQYRIPINVNIADPTWSEFFSEILSRHSSEELQNYVLDFITRVSQSYRKNQRSCDFITDILQLKVPNLFSSTSEPGADDMGLIEDRFSRFLQEYIRRNNLRPVIMKRIQEILVLVSEDRQTMFHWTVLNVLRLEIIPELKSLQDDDKDSTKQFKDLLKISVNTVTKKVSSWFGALSPRQRFCWGVVSAACSKIPMSAESFEWVFTLQPVIGQLGSVFNAYCNSRNLMGHACLLTEKQPQEIKDCQWEDIRSYFEWICNVQEVLYTWRNKFLSNNVNFDEIFLYASNIYTIDGLGRAVCAAEYVVDVQDVGELKKTFALSFEQLNCCLIRYVHNHSEVKFCNLPELLQDYGVSFPTSLKRTLEDKIIFPGGKRVSSISEDLLLSNAIPASANGDFEPGQDIALTITKSLSLMELQRLLEDLQIFLEPIIDHIEMFVFFHLQKSQMFIKHLLRRLDNIVEAASPKLPEKTFSAAFATSFRRSMAFGRKDEPKDEGVSMKVLQKALGSVRELLLKILRGTATYSDIVANGALELQTLNTEEEFGILQKFVDLFEMNRDNYAGLEGMRSMLELFQFTHHIDQINNVCEQYHLKKCLEDEQLKKLVLIVEEFKTETSRAKLTPLEATEKMAFIKTALCLQGRTNYNCLELFPAIAKSAPFYQFIQDKQFVGQKGKTLFNKQCHLLASRLEHDENVLNRLKAAFEFFAALLMEPNFGFIDLIQKVTKFDTTDGLKQLESVNKKMALVNLWFSTAEADSQANKEQDLNENYNDKFAETSERPSLLYEKETLVLQEERIKNRQLFDELQHQKQEHLRELEKMKHGFVQQLQQQEEEYERELEKVNHEHIRQLQQQQQECKKELEIIMHEKIQQQQDHKREVEEMVRNNTEQLRQQEHEHKRELEILTSEKIQIEEFGKQFEESWKFSHKDITMTNKNLGAGAWGAVIVGVFREQRVAVKQLHDLIMSEANLAVMNREINTMSRLRHPNLLLFIGAVLDHPSGNPLVITEIMDTSLRSAYEKGQITEESVKLSILRDTASALNYLHCHPAGAIIHRDVSSTNVLLETRGTNKWRAKLSDFGSANEVRKANTQAPGAQVYAAPESFVSVASRKKKVGPQTTKMDVFSFGVLTCEVMVCQFPDHEKFDDFLKTISISSSSIHRLLNECISEDPSDRPTMKIIIGRINVK